MLIYTKSCWCKFNIAHLKYKSNYIKLEYYRTSGAPVTAISIHSLPRSAVLLIFLYRKVDAIYEELWNIKLFVSCCQSRILILNIHSDCAMIPLRFWEAFKTSKTKMARLGLTYRLWSICLRVGGIRFALMKPGPKPIWFSSEQLASTWGWKWRGKAGDATS